jgi:hypothetical protein
MQFDFLICSERSGSNLITKILDSHPEVCGPSPSHIMRGMVPNLYRYGDLSLESHWNTLVEDAAELLKNKIGFWESDVDADILKENLSPGSFAALFRFVYEREAAAQGKRRLFVKENHAYSFAGFTLSHFPESRYVWMVRDPRDMALTWKEAGSAYGEVKTGTEVWRKDQRESLRLRACLADQDRMLMIQFEDLLSHTEETVHTVCRFLQLPYDTAMLDFHERPNTDINSKRLTSWKDLNKPIIKNNFNLFRKRLSEAEIRYIEAYCRDEMQALGYQFEYDGSGDSSQLEKNLPPEDFEPRLNEREKEIYPPFNAAMRKIAERRLFVC